MRLISLDHTGHTELATPDATVEAIITEAEGLLKGGRQLLVEAPGQESRYVRDVKDLPGVPEDATLYAFRPLAGG